MTERSSIGILSLALVVLSAFLIMIARNFNEQSRRSHESAVELGQALDRRQGLVEAYAKKQAELHAKEAEIWERLLAEQAEHQRCEGALLAERAAAASDTASPRRIPGPLPKPKPEEVWVQ